MRIRPAAPDELPVLQDIERAAGAAFRDLGMAAVADDEPPALDVLERYRRAGRAWVACAGGDGPAGYLICEPVDGALHIEQVSVHPDAARRGMGRALLAYAADRAHEEGLTGLTLTTFTEVPWNAPYYASRLPRPGRGRPHPGTAKDPRPRGGRRPRPVAEGLHACRTPQSLTDGAGSLSMWKRSP